MLMEIELGSTPPSPAAGAVTHLASPIDEVHQRVASPPPDHSTSEDNINLEAVHFEVQGADQVCCDSTLCNITVARGSRETQPLHIFADTSTPVDEVVANFAGAVWRDAPLPVLQVTPPRRRARPLKQEVVIRCSERLARKSRHRDTKPAVQAQNVMMRKLGITSDTQAPDATSYQRFMDTFASTLSNTHCEALDALLPSGLGCSLTSETAASTVASGREIVNNVE